MNYLRNNNTGAVYNFDSAPQGPALDYSNPIDIGGVKAYRLQSDPFTAVLPDGRKVQFGVDKAATDAANKSALDMQHSRLGNKLLETQIMAAAQREAPTLQHVETDQGVMVFNPRSGQMSPATLPDGSPMQGSKPLTEFQGKSTAFGMRAQNSSDLIDSIGEHGKILPSQLKQAAEAVPLVGGGLGALVNMLPEGIGGPSAKQQQVEQAQRDFINAVLRQESGAVIGQNEFDNARRQYFPIPGDSPEVIAQKQANREMAINGFKISAGPGARNFPKPAAPTGAAADAINQAKQAISAGAPRDAVARRLEQLGITNHGL